MKRKRISIAVGKTDRVSAMVAEPEGYRPAKTTAVIVAHGAGNDMENPLIVSFADGLADKGYLTLRFNFLYKEQGKKSPDSQEKLIETWLAVYRHLRESREHEPGRVVAAGKSMGGRVASQALADGVLAADGLVFLGYPLHPPGKKDQLRDAHFPRIKAPMLFFAGTRDPFCDLALLRIVLGRSGTDHELEMIEGGDHSFGLPKSSTTSPQEVQRRILDRTAQWLMEKM